MIEAHSTSLIVAWDPPTVKNGIISSYEVSWRSEDAEEGALNSYNTTARIEGLIGCAGYNISVAALTGGGISQPSTEVQGSTDYAGENYWLGF